MQTLDLVIQSFELASLRFLLIDLIWVLGQLHTRAKSRDFEIVRAQTNVSNGRPNTPPKRVVWSRTLKCSVKSYVIGPSTECYFNAFLFMQVLKYDRIE